MESQNRVVVLIDMDCFYCQVEEKGDPELKGKPIAVVQYNPWKGGGIIAVNYVARDRGVTRHMRGDEAKDKCPEIQLPSVPCVRGKADISKYRDAGIEVAKVLQKFTHLLERASIDEAYLDITQVVNERLKTTNIEGLTSSLMPNTYALGYSDIEDFIRDVRGCSNESIDFELENARQLLVAALVVSEIRAAVYEETGYRCSAGIAHNKILAKLVCGMNKPNKQTLLPKHSVNILYSTLSLKKVKHLGGKFGDTVCEVLKISKMGHLQSFTEKELQNKFDEKNGTWLYNIARGIDTEPVQAKFNPKSIGCCKQFRGKTALTDLESLRKWLRDLGDEIEERLEKDALESNRTPKQMVVSFANQMSDGKDVSSSRSFNFVSEDQICGDFLSSKALELVMDSMESSKVKDAEDNRKLKMPIKFLGISVGKFEDNNEKKNVKKIIDFFAAGPSKQSNKNVDQETKQDVLLKAEKKVKEKETIFQRFFQGIDKDNRSVNNATPSIVVDKVKEIEKPAGTSSLQTDLNNQESFFEKFLNVELKKANAKSCDSSPNSNSSVTIAHNIKNRTKVADENNKESRQTHPQTPTCEIINTGQEDSSDTHYSGSTINEEINQSVNLFDDAPEDTSRVSNMRNLLSTSIKLHEVDSDDDGEKIENNVYTSNELEESEDVCDLPSDRQVHKEFINVVEKKVEHLIVCPDCKESFPSYAFSTHADYHLALVLREEERAERRKEIAERTKSNNSESKILETSRRKTSKKENSLLETSKITEPKKLESNLSIENFLVKIDDKVPIEVCTKCSKKVPVDKFAEHQDFHEAQKLSRELNRKSPLKLKKQSPQISVKRKRLKLSPVKQTKKPCQQIDTFFR